MNRLLFDNDSQSQSTQVPVQKICFTANSIHYLATIHLPVNLDDWEWHEEVIDGANTFVITDKRSAGDTHLTFS
ncbi:hypothetical protein [Niabella hibiscisoli]|uniref:hypothetical protein n=1 Tax=Niabella hibiscisoli TaxID=1825928 RepID=UPI001F0E4D48|nr:hypothetical protein [Niabella hibiscisoli]MCH5718760.1 hypothetical protein [Niabella hibiscisoli]